MRQLSLFANAPIPDVFLPPEIDAALKNGAALAISISGGKDSQAMLIALTRLYQPSGWTGPLFAIHAHLGRAEWPQSLGMCQKMADDAGIVVACGSGALRLTALQRAGGKRLAVADFLRGQPVEPGVRLGQDGGD